MAAGSNRINLSVSEVEKDLGVFVDHDLSFKHHISQATAKANRVLGVIRRSFDYLEPQTFCQLYKSLVRPLLEYGHSVWQPRLKGLCQDIEDVQRRATRLMPGMKDMTYEERLKSLNLPSLEHRRLRGDMIDTYKYVHHKYEANRPVLPPAPDAGTRGHEYKLFRNFTSSTMRTAYFSRRVVSNWNSLPSHVVTAPNVDTFKGRLDSHYKQSPDIHRFAPQCYIKFSKM